MAHLSEISRHFLLLGLIMFSKKAVGMLCHRWYLIKLTIESMYVKCNIVARYVNHCCSEKATMCSVFVVEVLFTVNNIKVLIVAKQCFMARLCRRKQ
jgi:hypothetical protein